MANQQQEDAPVAHIPIVAIPMRDGSKNDDFDGGSGGTAKAEQDEDGNKTAPKVEF